MTIKRTTAMMAALLGLSLALCAGTPVARAAWGHPEGGHFGGWGGAGHYGPHRWGGGFRGGYPYHVWPLHAWGGGWRPGWWGPGYYWGGYGWGPAWSLGFTYYGRIGYYDDFYDGYYTGWPYPPYAPLYPVSAVSQVYDAPVYASAPTAAPAAAFAPAPVPTTPAAASQATGQECREYTSTVKVGGQDQQVMGTACRQPDGSWRIIN